VFHTIGGNIRCQRYYNGIDPEKEAQLFLFQTTLLKEITGSLKRYQIVSFIGQGAGKSYDSAELGDVITINNNRRRTIYLKSKLAFFESGIAEVDKVQS